jgi:hypothetical protein
MALLPTNEYKPYKRGRKWIQKHIEHQQNQKGEEPEERKAKETVQLP